MRRHSRRAATRAKGAHWERTREDARVRRDREEEQLFETGMFGVARCRSSGRLEAANDVLLELLGYTLADLERGELDWRRLTPIEWAEQDARALAQATAGERVAPYEKELVRHDGTSVPVLVEVTGWDRSRDTFTLVVLDLTDRKRLEKERQTFAALVEYSSDFIGIADLDGTPTYVNPAGRRMVGLPAELPIESTSIPDYYPEELRPFVRKELLPVMLERGHWAGETYFRHWQTGREIPVSDTHFMIRDPITNRLLGHGTITRDISDARRVALEREELLAREASARREAELSNEQLRAANEEITRLYEKSKELDELKTRFFASVSHELRTPLTLILGPIQQLLACADVGDAVRSKLEVIERNARMLLGHVNDLLDMSKLEAGLMVPQYASTDVAHELRFLAGNFESFADESGIRFTFGRSPPVPMHVDPEKLRRMLLNLLSNAFKFTPAGGRVRVSLHPSADRILLEVADSGPGIAPSERELVFERFRQLPRETTRRFGGAGLGLTIARELAALHGGDIRVSDAPEGGALFVIELPRWAPASVCIQAQAEASGRRLPPATWSRSVEELRPPPRDPAPRGAEGGSLVLVVEDNVEMNQFVCDSLACEYRVVPAFDGQDALNKALELDPDLILTDAMMPEMGGDDLVRAIREHRQLDATPIVVLTAKADDDFRVRLLREGAQDYVTKPFSVEELRARVGAATARKKAVDVGSRLTSLVESAEDGIIDKTLDGVVRQWSRGAERIYGFSAAEMIGRSIRTVVPADRMREHDELHARVCRGELIRGVDVVRVRKDGTRVPIALTLSLIKDAAGRVLGVSAIERDVTERKRAERVLRESEERFRLTFEEAPIGMALVSLQGRFIRVNKALCEITGYGPDELTRLTSRQITHPDDSDAGVDLARRVVSGELPRYQLGTRYLRKDGTVIDVMTSASVVRDDQGQALYYIGEIEDVTERKRLEAERERLLETERRYRRRLEALRESALTLSEVAAPKRTGIELLQAIVDHARELTAADYGAIAIDADPTGRPGSCVWSGISAEQAAVVRDHPRPIDLLGWDVDGRPVRLEHIHDHSASKPVLAEMDAFLGVPIRRHGRIVGYLYLAKRFGKAPFSAEDESVAGLLVHHAAIALENAQLYEELQAAVRAREELLAIVSHDLRSPLNSISLREDILARSGDPKITAHAAGVRRAIDTMLRLIQELLDMDSSDQGRLRLEMGESDIASVFDEVIETNSPLAASKGIRIERRLETSGAMRCDRARVVRVLANLVSNALRFTHRGGAITLRVERKRSEVLVSVSDTGVGIAPDVLRHVFDRYFTTTGTGLGLHIAKVIVEAHGGRIWATSEPGRGTTFFFTLPEPDDDVAKATGVRSA